ncbi:MAG: MMPL family transporter [Myxococcaceae bacterium]
MHALDLLSEVHERLRAHPWRTAAVCVAVLAACGWVTSRVRLDENVAALLPTGPGSPGEAAALLAEFGALDTLLVGLSVPGATTDELVAAGDDLVGKLRESGRFTTLYSGPRDDELTQLAGVVLPRRLMLLDDPRAELEARLEPERLRASLSALKGQLSSMQALALKRQLLADPLGLNPDLLASLGRQAGNVRLERGHLLSADGKHLLLVAIPKARALDVGASQALMEELAQLATGLKERTGGRAVLRWAGGPRFAAESATAIRGDISFNFFFSTLITLVVFVLRFRGLRLLLLSFVPLVFGVLGAAAVMALWKGRMHGLTFGFGSALVGIAMDYPLHLINHAASAPGDRAEAYARTTRTVLRGLFLGFVTTAMGFAALTLSGFPGLRELALFSGVGLVLAFAANLVLVPPLCAALGPQRPSPTRAAFGVLRWALPGRWAWAVSAGLLLLGGVYCLRVRFDGDLRNLDSMNPRTLAEHAELLALFGQPSDSSLVVATGASLEEALQKNDQVAQALERLKARGVVQGAASLSGLLPSAATQRSRAERLKGLDLEQAKGRLAVAAAEAGFSETAFDGFWAEVASVSAGEVTALEGRHLEGSTMGLFISRAARCGDLGCKVATSLERAPSSSPELVQAGLPPGVQWVDSGALAAQTLAQIPRQLALLCAIGVLGNLLFLAWIYRSFKYAVLACLPCAVALVLTVGLMSALQMPLNLVSAGGLVLVFGCGVDYGIFSLEGLTESEPSGVEQLGVLLAAFTTLAGFGTLALAQNGAMRTLGIATGLGTAISAAVALVLLPGLAKSWIRAPEAPPAPSPLPSGE